MSPAAEARERVPATVDPTYAAEHLPAPADLGLRPVRGRPPAALPARPRGRLGLPVAAARGRGRAASTATTSPCTPARTPSAAVPPVWRCCPPWRTGWTWGCWSTSSPTMSGWRARGRRRGGGTSSSSGRRRGRGVLRHRLGGRWRPASAAGARRRRRAAVEVARGAARGPLPRPAAPDGARHDHPRGAALRARVVAPRATPSSTTAASSRSRRWPACAWRSRRSSRPRTGRSGAGSTSASWTGCASTTPTGCATRRLPRPAGQADRRRRTSWSRRSSSRASRCRPRGPPRAPPATTCSALVDRVLTDPAGEAALTALGAASTTPSWCTRPSAPWPTRRCRPRYAGSSASSRRRGLERRASRTRWPSCSPASRSTAPTSRSASSTWTQAFASARARRPDLLPRPRRPGARAVRPGPAGRAAVPADQRDGDGEGRRGLCVLPLLAAHLAQRGRRRPGGVRGLRRRVPRRDGAPAGRVARRDDHPVDPRHQAQRGRAGPDRRAGRGAGPLGADARHAARRWRRCPTPASATCSGRRRTAPGRSPGSGCTPTPRRRCARPATTRRGPTRTRTTSARCTPRSTRRTTTSEVRAAVEALDGAAVGGRPRQLRCPPSCSRSRCPGVPDVYQGSELRRPQPGRPGQPPPGGLRRRRARARRPAANPKQAPHRRALRLRRDRPELFTSYTPLRGRGSGGRARARLRPRRRGHRRDPAAARAGEQRRLG